jgi:hypothetical protein
MEFFSAGPTFNRSTPAAALDHVDESTDVSALQRRSLHADEVHLQQSSCAHYGQHVSAASTSNGRDHRSKPNLRFESL